jgi:hypothetical protein
MENLSPSPAISVPSDTTIRETLRVMREHNVGSVLVNNYQHPHNLVGIFTERDLLKWVGEIEKHGSWDTGIATIMTKKIISLSLLEIDRAPEVMVENNIRHLPIVYETEIGHSHVAGVVSMRDAFRSLIAEKREKAVTAQYMNKRTIMLGHGAREREVQKKLLEQYLDLQVISEDFSQSVDPVKLIPSILTGDLFILDLDHFAASFWPLLLKRILDEKVHPHVFVVYDPVLQEAKSVQALKQLSKGSVIHVFPKPVNLLEYLRQIEKALKGDVKTLS